VALPAVPTTNRGLVENLFLQKAAMKFPAPPTSTGNPENLENVFGIFSQRKTTLHDLYEAK
jgi:hypothetical protein